ncbi:MAG TPA: protein kinase [Pyrinomonadaceae bacterium]|nr:protein kinase [Pyrinomonadaceae bacterium]
MDPDLWKQVDALLEEALALPHQDRKPFAIQAAGDNSKLREEVLSLLDAQSQASNFMERSAMKVAAAALAKDQNLTTSFLHVGRRLGAYKIEKLLGTGGMGEVYLARDGKLGRNVALKILPVHFVADTERSARFQREARALSSLNHPNLVTVYEVGEADGLHFIAMEFVAGSTLSSLRNSASLKEILSIVAQVAEAVSAAHQSGIVHRDIKPENIMVRADGYAKVLDFGLVKLVEHADPREQDAANTQLGVAMGTLAYMSPEQASGESIDHRTDIWSLGVVLYELSTGQRPFKGATRQDTVNEILSREPTPPSVVKETLPKALDLIVSKALEKDRELRYQTSADFRSDIRRLLREIDSSATASAARSVTTSDSNFKHRPWVLPLIVMGLVICTAIAGVWYFMTKKPIGPDWSRANHLQLTNQAGTEFFPVLAPDGKSFVYASNQTGNYDLFLQRVGGKIASPLTPNTPSDDTEPAFSPNGERIAFHSSRSPAGIYMMEATGENARPVTANCHHPSWSPDGKEIVCSTFGYSLPSTRNVSPSALWVADVETGTKRLLIQKDAMQPTWSPNGPRIAFSFMPPSAGRSDIATVSRFGGEPVVVTNDASTNWNPVWSPDGKYLYYASDRSGNMSFWRIAIDEQTGSVLSEPESVSTPSTFSRHLNFSRDGKRLIYVQTDQQSNIRAIKFDPRLEKPVGEPFWITRGDVRIVRPELSPDGTRFVMRVPRRTQDDIVIVDRDGNNWRDLTNDKFFDRYPRWSPDGKKIVFTSDRSGQYEIWMIDAEGNNLKQLSFNSPGDATFPLWSPDGTRLLFQRNKSNVIIDLNKGWSEQTPVKLTDSDRTFVAWDWSLDGKKLIGTFTDGHVGYFEFDTNRYERLADFGAYPMWLPDSSRYIAFVESKVFLGDVRTRKISEIFSIKDAQIRSIAISRDAQLIYFTDYASESDIWMLDLN